ncbi:MAG: hypothetical protein IJ242_01200 [Clostridia bacterium]|nr:hypothetical protein [Clostridia bacterium]
MGNIILVPATKKRLNASPEERIRRKPLVCQIMTTAIDTVPKARLCQ